MKNKLPKKELRRLREDAAQIMRVVDGTAKRYNIPEDEVVKFSNERLDWLIKFYNPN